MQYHRERAWATNHSVVDDRTCEGGPLPVMEQVHSCTQRSVRVMHVGTYYELTDRHSVFA